MIKDGKLQRQHQNPCKRRTPASGPQVVSKPHPPGELASAGGLHPNMLAPHHFQNSDLLDSTNYTADTNCTGKVTTDQQERAIGALAQHFGASYSSWNGSFNGAWTANPTSKFQGEYLMKQIMFLMAIVGLAATGCAQNRVLGTHARRGGGASEFQMARSQAMPQQNTSFASNEADDSYGDSDIQQAMYGGRCRGGCASGGCDCSAGCDCNGGCDGGCDDSCCGNGGCADGCCGDGGCSVGGGRAGGGQLRGRIGGRVANLKGRVGGGCSACGGLGCGLCQRVVGKVANGFCPHGGGYPANYNYNPSPPSGQVAYPYYTVRGPRDFLRNNPPSIGPY